jgi:hypothetical protein
MPLYTSKALSVVKVSVFGGLIFLKSTHYCILWFIVKNRHLTTPREAQGLLFAYLYLAATKPIPEGGRLIEVRLYLKHEQ